MEESQRAITDFKDDGRSGRHDPQWLREALEASGRRMAGDYEEYLESQFKDTYGEEKEELSDTESERGADEETDEHMSVDQAPPPKKDNDDEDNTGGGEGPSVLLSNGEATSVSNQSAQTINEPAPDNNAGGTYSNTQRVDSSDGNRQFCDEVPEAGTASDLTHMPSISPSAPT